jgi:phosphohistidine phosphatase
MRRLILFRHAKTEARPPGSADFDRRLVERGRSDAAAIGKALAAAGMTPDLALVSPAVRARETWDCVKAEFPAARVELRAGLYDASCEEVAAEIDLDTQAAGTVMVVGHNPSLHELAVNMLIESDAPASDIERLSAGFPTSAAAVFAIDAAGRSRLEALFHARDHRGGD